MLRPTMNTAARLGFVILLSSFPAMAGPQPVPTTQQIAQADQAIADTYKDKLARPGQADRVALATELLSEADRNVADPDSQYALLCKARDVAANAGDVELALKACDKLTDNFAVSPGVIHVIVYTKAAGAMFTPDDSSTFVASALQSADAALKLDDFDSANALLKVASSQVTKARNNRLSEMVRLHQEASATQQREFKKVRPLMTELTTRPDDAKLNLAVGKYVCFEDGDWDRGLPLLARGSDAHLADLATQDLQAPLEPEAQESLGDSWFRYADQASRFEKLRIDMRANDWLQKALPHLTGLKAAQAQAHIKEMDPAISQYYDWGEIWLAVRSALAQHNAVATDVVGGAFGKRSFQELPQAGEVLVGFKFGLGKFVNNDVITQIQAVYQTPTGKENGEVFGTSTGPFVDAIARNGYAVGAMDIRGGGGLDSVSITFMKIVGNHLDPSQSYESDHIGGTRSNETDVSGGGIPIIGIVGKTDGKGQLAGLGVVFAAAPDNAEDTTIHRAGRKLTLSPVP